jgi:hypothetical protein
MSCPLLTASVDGVKPLFMLEVEIYATDPYSVVFFHRQLCQFFLFFLIIEFFFQ